MPEFGCPCRYTGYEKRSGYVTARVSPYIFSPKSKLKLQYIFVTPKMVKKVIKNLNSSMASGPDCITVVVLKNCEPELSYIPVELFSMCMKESLVVSVFKNVGDRFTAKNYPLLVFFLWLVKSLRNL